MPKAVMLEQIQKPLREFGSWLDDTIPSTDRKYHSLLSSDGSCQTMQLGCRKRMYLGGVSLSVMEHARQAEPGELQTDQGINLSLVTHGNGCSGTEIVRLKHAAGSAERVDDITIKGNTVVRELAIRRSSGSMALWLYDSCDTRELWHPGETEEDVGAHYSRSAPMTDPAEAGALLADMRELVLESFPAAV
jgi:hypothetical protein